MEGETLSLGDMENINFNYESSAMIYFHTEMSTSKALRQDKHTSEKRTVLL